MRLVIEVPAEHAAKLTALAKSMRTTPQHIAQSEFVALWLLVKARALDAETAAVAARRKLRLVKR